MLGGTPGTLHPLTGPLGQMFIRQAHHSVQGEIVAMAKQSKQKKKKNGRHNWPINEQPTGKNFNPPNGQSLATNRGLSERKHCFRKAYNKPTLLSYPNSVSQGNDEGGFSENGNKKRNYNPVTHTVGP